MSETRRGGNEGTTGTGQPISLRKPGDPECNRDDGLSTAGGMPPEGPEPEL